MPLMCDRCGRPIPAGDEERVTIHGASGAGGTITVHASYCLPPRSRPAPGQRVAQAPADG